MRAFVTGATGFIGGRVAAKLLERGWDVTALARTPERAAGLRALGATVVPGDVTEPATLAGPMRRADAVFHLAAWYALGVGDRHGMYRINVRGTEHALAAAAEARVERILYCSSVAALGPGEPDAVGDETRRHPGRFGSVYEETKWQAHEKVRAAAAGGAPVVSVLPGAVYGPGDTSILATMLRLYAKGWLLACPWQEAGFSWVHVDDVAEGMLLAVEKGRLGEDYILAGENETIGGLLRRVAPATGIRPPRWSVPAPLVRAALPLGPLVGRMLGQAPGILRDGVEMMRGSWLFSSDKARRELGYAFRPIEEGVPGTVDWLRAR